MASYIGVSPSPELNVSNIANNAVTTDKILDGTIANADVSSSAAIATSKLAANAITINGSSVALGGSITLTTETRPTVSSISPTVITNSQTSVVFTGTNYVSVPLVTAIHSTTGATIVADEVSFSSATSITAKFTISVDGTYKLYVENPDGNAVQTGTILTVSDLPSWTTSAGSLGSFGAASSIGTITLTATNSTGMTLQSGSLPGGISLNSGSGSSTLTGTESGSTQDTTYSFTIRATDAEGQTADRAFTITITHAANNSGNFN